MAVHNLMLAGLWFEKSLGSQPSPSQFRQVQPPVARGRALPNAAMPSLPSVGNPTTEAIASLFHRKSQFD